MLFYNMYLFPRLFRRLFVRGAERAEAGVSGAVSGVLNEYNPFLTDFFTVRTVFSPIFVQ